MRALITGASSGLGRDFAVELSNMGYELILVARSEKGLKETAMMCKTNTFIECMDLSDTQNCKQLYSRYKDIDILINNAGFGLFGEFFESDIEKELLMIDLNIKSVHVLTKLYLKDMIRKNSGRILNVASSAAFLPGPLMSTYYATKSYVYKLTTAVYEELKKINSNVKISVLCPGPVETNFNNVANVSFSLKGLSSRRVTNYALNRFFKNKLVIIPGFTIRLGVWASKLLPLNILLKINYRIQKRKDK